MRSICAALLLTATAMTTAASAEDQKGCEGFNWPLTTELSWMAQDPLAAKSGDTLDAIPEKAITLALQPTKSVTFAAPPGAKKQALPPDSYSGVLTLPAAAKPGLYQISLSSEGWIDVVQNTALVASTAFTGRKECAVIHKSVRFPIAAGPFTVQVSGLSKDTAKLTIKAAE